MILPTIEIVLQCGESVHIISGGTHLSDVFGCGLACFREPSRILPLAAELAVPVAPAPALGLNCCIFGPLGCSPAGLTVSLPFTTAPDMAAAASLAWLFDDQPAKPSGQESGGDGARGGGITRGLRW